jgi:hypothetical protein
LGQTRLQRTSGAAIYAGVELASIAMLIKSRYELNIAKRRAKEVVIAAYATNDSGAPEIKGGAYVPRDTVPNRYGQRTSSTTTGEEQLRTRVKSRRLQYEDWVATLIFTHLFAGADAFVSAHLYDLPKQVEIRRLPSGDTGLGLRFSLR